MDHAFPSAHSAVEPAWARADWYPMVTAWFDRYLKGVDTGVEQWPDVQVQASTGEWWTVDEYPTTGGPLGQLALCADGSLGTASPHGVRSLQHIDPIPNGWFEQEAGKEIATNEPVRVTIRFLPTDLVVPAGGSLRLTIAGGVSYQKGDSLPSGAASEITILHNCDRPSFLRFRMPDPKASLLNVRERRGEAAEARVCAGSRGRADGRGPRHGQGLRPAPPGAAVM